MHGEVVEQQAGARLERHRVGQFEHPIRMQRNDFGHGAAQHRQAAHPVTRSDVRAVGGAADHARDLGARRVGHLRLVLVEPARLQRVGERDAGRVDVDQNRTVCGGFVEFDDFRGLWTVEAGYLYRAHRDLSLVDAPI